MKLQSPPSREQRGMSLIFALLALVALSLATLALVRSVDTSSMLLGNVGFKQDATVSGDQASRLAVAWLKANVTSLDTDAPSSGYYSSTKEVNGDGTKTLVDATGQQLPPTLVTRKLIDWSTGQDGQCPYAASGTYASCTIRSANADISASTANTARYVIFRLCANTGTAEDEVANSCAKPLSDAGAASGRGALAYGTGRIGTKSGPYYRIVVRILGPRNTTSFTETIVNFQ
jgi:Tfp pilus assembly protein PilV